jgi:hypothetical protein
MLGPLLESHAPLDWVVFMLGTNAVWPSYRLSAAKEAVSPWPYTGLRTP